MQVADLVEVLHRDMVSTGRHYLLRASHNIFFSHNSLTGCVDVGAESSTMVIQLDLSRMNQVLRLDIDEGIVTVQAGITFEDLEEFLLGRGLSLQGLGIVTPPFAGMSLGAAIESAAHGSSLVGPASIAAGLRSAVLVDGSGSDGCRHEMCSGALSPGSLNAIFASLSPGTRHYLTLCLYAPL